MKNITQNKSFQNTVDLVTEYAIFTLDTEGIITSWNKGAELITGWKKDEVMGQFFDFLILDEDIKAGKPRKYLEKALKKGKYEEEGTRKRKNGEIYIADSTMTPIFDDETKKPIGFVKVIRDITHRKQEEADQLDANSLLRKEIEIRKKVENALTQSNEELDAFASAASHDLQEPLRMVVSYLQLLERRYGDRLDTDGKVFLNFAVDGANRMKILISDLVDYSRIGTFGKPFSTTAVGEVVRRAINNLEVTILENHAQITYDKLPTVTSDSIQLARVFQNLLVNAIKFKGDEAPRIHIGVYDKKTEWVFFVTDNGRGIEQKNLTSVFTIFKQLGRRDERKGSGVGLAIAKKIITRHHGTMWVESTVGKGSTFFFSIPKRLRKEAKND